MIGGLLLTGLLSVATVGNPSLRVAARDGFPFPTDRGGQLLGQLLAPSDKAITPSGNNRLAPLHLPGPLDRKGLEASLPPLAPDLPRSAVTPSAPPARPRPLPEEPPLVRSFFDPLMPQALTLPAGAGVRLPSLAIDRPPPLPILAQPQPDRASLQGP